MLLVLVRDPGTADHAVFGSVIGDEKVSVPYLNKGFLQGTMAGLQKIYSSNEDLWSILVCETVLHDSGRELRRYHRFVLKGDELKFIAGFELWKSLLVCVVECGLIGFFAARKLRRCDLLSVGKEGR